MKKDGSVVFVIGAALTGVLIAVLLELLDVETAAIVGAVGFGVALWLIGWVGSRRKSIAQPGTNPSS